MKAVMKWGLYAVIIVAVVAGGYWGYIRFLKPALQPAPEVATTDADAASDDLTNVIWASGKLEPIEWAALSPAIAGTVARIHVAEGDQVTAGQLLLELNNEPLQSQVGIAQAALVETEAARAQLLAGATVGQIAAAEAQLAAADAAVRTAASQMLELQAAIDSANAQVNIAQRQYNELASHPTDPETSAAQAEIAVAEAAVSQAQAAYNLVRGEPNIGALPQSMQLYQATATLDAAKARAALTTQGATEQQLAVAAAAISAAQSQVAATRSRTSGVEAAVESALARRAAAQADLDTLRAGATPTEIAVAEAHVQSARAALASAEANLRQSQVLAPFAGQVGTISVRIGELTAPGQATILLGDSGQMQVETTDLRETDVVRLQVAMPVEVTFDALPNRIFQGVVTQIAPVSNVEKGSTNYTVHVDVADLDPNLRWGMTAFVNIQPTQSAAAPKPAN